MRAFGDRIEARVVLSRRPQLKRVLDRPGDDTSVTDVVREYLRSRKYADFVVRDGLAGLVRSWERVVGSVVSGEEQYQDDYLNDMDGRRILAEALEVAPPEERSQWAERVRIADEMIRRHLIPTSGCIWGDENAVKHGYSRERDWWYYYRPKKVEQEWRSF
jgi:hypothetical protein